MAIVGKLIRGPVVKQSRNDGCETQGIIGNLQRTIWASIIGKPITGRMIVNQSRVSVKPISDTRKPTKANEDKGSVRRPLAFLDQRRARSQRVLLGERRFGSTPFLVKQITNECGEHEGSILCNKVGHEKERIEYNKETNSKRHQ